MNISFPQNLFQCPPKQNIIQGKNICKQSRILFCGIARNVEHTLDLNLQRVTYLQKYFKSSDIFIYENDSIDNTINILKKYNLYYLSEKRIDADYKIKIDNGQDKNYFNRCKILSECRNKYIEYIEKNCSLYDFICIIDWDIHGWSYKGFFDSIYRISQCENIASVSAYGLLSNFENNITLEEANNNYLMYDTFAFRPLNHFQPLYSYFQSNFNYYKCQTPERVRSNFGGMTIYKKEIISKLRYDAREIDGTVDCDHVVINDKISDLGFIHIMNNYFIVSYSKHRFDNDRLK